MTDTTLQSPAADNAPAADAAPQQPEHITKAVEFLDQHLPLPGKSAAPTEPTEDEPEPDEESWLDDDLRAEAQAHGFNDDDLAAFGGAAQLRATMRIADRNLRTSAREAFQPKTAEPSQAPAPPTAPEASDPNDPLALFDQTFAKIKAEEYGDELVQGLHSFRDMLKGLYTSQQQKLEQAYSWIQQEQQARQHQANTHEAQQFASFVGQLGHAELFGKDLESATPAQQENWKKAFSAYLEIKGGEYLRTGQAPAISAAMVKRAITSEFHDQIIKQTEKALANKVRASAANRMGGGNRQQAPGPYSGPMEQDPVLLDAYAKLKGDPQARLTGTK